MSAKRKRRKPVQCSAIVRPPFKLYQTLRHKLTGEIMVVSEIICDVVKLKPAISEVTVTKWGYTHWEVV